MAQHWIILRQDLGYRVEIRLNSQAAPTLGSTSITEKRESRNYTIGQLRFVHPTPYIFHANASVDLKDLGEEVRCFRFKTKPEAVINTMH